MSKVLEIFMKTFFAFVQLCKNIRPIGGVLKNLNIVW